MEEMIDYIERFFNGVLSKEELAEFEKRRSVDKAFDHEVRNYLLAMQIIRTEAGKRMKDRLDKIGKNRQALDMVETNVKHRFISKNWLGIAASVILISALGYVALNGSFRQNQVSTLADLYENYYEKPGIDQVITRSSDEEQNEVLWNSSLDKYNNADYTAALKDFNSLLSSPDFTHRSAANFFAGICYLNLNETDSAIRQLKLVSLSSAFSYESEWYIILSYLKAGNKSEAVVLCTEIKKNKNHPYREDAGQLMKKMVKLEKKAESE
jgi:hypothetical protein